MAAMGDTAGRVFNFAAGPACLPVEVLQEAQADLLNYKGSGASVMEMSHRSKEFEGIIASAEKDLRTLLSIPDNYKVLFLQGGASTAFAMLPLNLTAPGETADYIVTGAWSKKAAEEGAKVGAKANVAAKGDNKSIPPRDSWKLTPGAKFVHYCDNETIGVGCLRGWAGLGWDGLGWAGLGCHGGFRGGCARGAWVRRRGGRGRVVSRFVLQRPRGRPRDPWGQVHPKLGVGVS